MTMTKENKELLLKDLCGRLPYGVKVLIKGKTMTDSTRKQLAPNNIFGIQKDVLYVKPYLRPMSSMTEEEREEYRTECKKVLLMRYRVNSHYPVTDWLNAHHFDYRGLIEKGLALEAPEGIYKTE